MIIYDFITVKMGGESYAVVRNKKNNLMHSRVRFRFGFLFGRYLLFDWEDVFWFPVTD